MIYLFWFVHILCGVLTDSRMWGDKYKDPEWVKEYTDIFWLGWFAVVPFVAVYVGSDILTIKSALIAVGMSFVWDVIYSKLEHGKYVAGLPLWLILPNPFSKDIWYKSRIIIGFTERQMYYFNGIRILILCLTLFM